MTTSHLYSHWLIELTKAILLSADNLCKHNSLDPDQDRQNICHVVQYRFPGQSVTKFFLVFLNQNICCGYTQKNRPNKTVLLSTQNKCLN